VIIALQLIALSCVVVGILLTARKKRAAWLVYEIGGVAWVALYLSKGLYIAVLAQLVFMTMNIYGWIQWGKHPAGSRRGDKGEA
jgi:nicotinamide mononucleotide transporter